MTTAVFDAVAPSYDAEFTDTLLGRWLRRRVQQYLTFTPGQSVLEIGCGTGEDAAWLGQRGVSVLATDISPGMLAVARRKAAGLPVAFAQQDAGSLHVDGSFDGAFANFGVLNCVADLPSLARRLPIRRGGAFVAVVMGPFCLWETTWYALHGDVRRATQWFTIHHCEGLGTLLPPSYLGHLVNRWPPALAGLDSRMPFGQYWADHYVAVFERR